MANSDYIDTDPLADPVGAFYFSLEINKVEVAQFTECSGLKTSATVFEIEEGGVNTHTHKRPGYSKWDNIVLKKGVSTDDEFVDWRDRWLTDPDNWSERPNNTGAVVVRDNAGTELRRYSFHSFWPVMWEGPSFAAGGSDLAIETLEIGHDGITIDDSPGAEAPTRGDTPAPPQPADQDDTVVQFVATLQFDITQSDPQGLEGLMVEDHVDMMGAMRVTINHHGFDWSKVTLGDGIECGFGKTADKTFGGYITGLRHFMQNSATEMAQIIALDPLCKLGASRHTRVFEEMTDSDIANAVLGESGVEIGTVDSTSATFKYVLQRNESDLRFLRRLAARNGYFLLGNYEGKVDFKKPQFGGTALEYDREQLQAFEYTVSSQNVPTGVTVYGWDYIAKEKVEGTAGSGEVDGIGGGSNAVDETGPIWQDESFISDVWVNDQAVAKEMATAHMNRMSRMFVQGRAVVEGSGEIRAGKRIKFSGFATGFNPEALVVASKHSVHLGLYTTEFWFVGNTLPE